MKFIVEIELGNDQMKTPVHLSGALLALSRRIQDIPSVRREDDGRIKDLNGNTVGSWKLTRE